MSMKRRLTCFLFILCLFVMIIPAASAQNLSQLYLSGQIPFELGYCIQMGNCSMNDLYLQLMLSSNPAAAAILAEFMQTGAIPIQFWGCMQYPGMCGIDPSLPPAVILAILVSQSASQSTGGVGDVCETNGWDSSECQGLRQMLVSYVTAAVGAGYVVVNKILLEQGADPGLNRMLFCTREQAIEAKAILEDALLRLEAIHGASSAFLQQIRPTFNAAIQRLSWIIAGEAGGYMAIGHWVPEAATACGASLATAGSVLGMLVAVPAIETAISAPLLPYLSEVLPEWVIFGPLGQPIMPMSGQGY